MNTLRLPNKTLLSVAVATLLLAACSAAPTKPDGAASLRSRLSQLQSDPQLGTGAPLAMKEAEVAVAAAEQPQTDKVMAAHLVFMADKKISIAQAQAESHLAVEQRKGLTEQREAMRLQSRTQEADAANRRANVAVADADEQKRAAELARAQADAARNESADAQSAALELQRQINDLQAQVTGRGLVLTLGDVLFASGTAELNAGGASHLVKLGGFLNKYPERTTVIEGYTDSVGSDEFNQALSQRRADAVKSYLVGQGINASRLTAAGKGESSPVGNNGSSTGRQQNRRVEVVIDNPTSPTK